MVYADIGMVAAKRQKQAEKKIFFSKDMRGYIRQREIDSRELIQSTQ